MLFLRTSSPPFSALTLGDVPSNTFSTDFLIDTRCCSFQHLLRQFYHRRPTLFIPMSSYLIVSLTPNDVISTILSADSVVDTRHCSFWCLLCWFHHRLLNLSFPISFWPYRSDFQVSSTSRFSSKTFIHPDMPIHFYTSTDALNFSILYYGGLCLALFQFYITGCLPNTLPF